MMVSGILLVTDGAPSLDGKAIAILCAGLLTLAACVAFLVWCHGWARRRWRDHWPVILLTCLWFGIGAGAYKLGLAWHAQQHSAHCGCHASGRVKPRLPAATVGGLWPGGQTRFGNLSCAGTLSLSRRRPAIQPFRCTKRQLPAVVARFGLAQRPFDIAEQQRSVFTDQSGEPALNLDIICLEIAGLIVRVFRLQTNAARLFQQGFQRGFLLLDQCDNNVAMIGRA